MLSKSMDTEIEINATAQRVWQTLTDFDAYPAWNPMLRQATGELKAGALLRVSFQIRRGKMKHSFRPLIMTVDPGRELRWTGRMRLPLLFDMQHYWIITPLPENKSHVRHGVMVMGLAAPFSGKILRNIISRTFKGMNSALKERAESPGNLPNVPLLSSRS